MKLDNYVKIEAWFDSSIGQSTVIQKLDKKRPKLSNQNQTQNRRRYVNFENGSHFISFVIIISDHHVSSTIHLFALGFNLSCGVTSCHSCGITLSRRYISITAIPPPMPQLWHRLGGGGGGIAVIEM